jgi:hypothetical protein
LSPVSITGTSLRDAIFPFSEKKWLSVGDEFGQVLINWHEYAIWNSSLVENFECLGLN